MSLTFPSDDSVRELILLAQREDLGPGRDDVTSRLLIPETKVGVATLVQKEPGVVCGLPIVQMVCNAYDERMKVELIPGFHLDLLEGHFSEQKRMPLLRIRGPMRSLLSAERVLLNFIQHLSGVASLTHRFVKRVEGTRAKIYDTRKTLPGFRSLDKYAVRAGGGFNHRIGLYDGLLIKDNHIASIPPRELSQFLTPIIKQTRSEDAMRLVEVEVDNLEQLREVLRVENIDVVLLDNMDCPSMQAAVAMRDEAGKKDKIGLEASGGISLSTVREVALTGVDRISIGALTHSASALDIGLDIEDE